MQEGLLFHTLYEETSDVYCAQWMCTFDGALIPSALQQAWQRVLEHHAVLRTAFNWTSHRVPFQIVYRQIPLPWREEDWRHVPITEQESALETFLHQDRQQGFNLSRAPLLRLSLIRIAEQSYHFVFTFHHLLLDGWSLALLRQDVFQAYEALCHGREQPLALRRPYTDYIAWRQQQSLSEAECFWRATLAGFTVPTPLTVNREVSSTAALASAHDDMQHIRLSRDSTTKLQVFAQQHHLSLNTLLQGAWALLLSRYSGQDDVVFGAVVSGRSISLEDVESMVGLFINTLPVRVQVPPEDQLLPWLRALQNQQSQAYQFEYSPLVEVQTWSEVPRGQPLFKSLFVFENYPRDEVLLSPILNVTLRQVRWFSKTTYPLTIIAMPGAELELRFTYTCRDFDTATMCRMAGHLQTLLEGMTAAPEHRLKMLPLLTPQERDQILREWNHTQREYPQDMRMHQLIAAQVARTPDATALVFEGDVMTYREVNARANQLAHFLQALGVGPETLVGICLERSFDLVIGLLGILKAGAAYLPLDPEYPSARLTYMVADARLSVLLTLDQNVAKFTCFANGGRLICLDLEQAQLAQQSQDNPPRDVGPDHLAYVMYTSGSTGRPKGVAIPHRALSHHMWWMQTTFPMTAADRIVQKTSIGFDASVWEIFAPLTTGGQLIIARPGGHQDSAYLANLLATHQITALKVVPSLLHMLLEEPDFEKCQHLRHVFCGGESLSPALQEKFFSRLKASLHNLYGPTETTIDVTWWTCDPETLPHRVPIGRPIANTQIYLLDAHLQPVPIGVPGELYIGGASLARGYLHRPALTAERFIPNPFSASPNACLYKTGDVARYRPDGNIEFLGRLDYQVNIRGYRIELGEIEAILGQCAAVRQAIVMARQDHSGLQRLVAYVVAHGETAPPVDTLRSFLETWLPGYMIPAAFVILEQLPLTPTGKIDRQALPEPAQDRPALSAAFEEPRTPIEEMLAGVWETVLGLNTIGIHDNFFALGGHSLRAMQVVSRLRQVLAMDITLRELFDAPTIATLAMRLEVLRRAQQNMPLLHIQPVARDRPVPLTVTQEHFWALDRLLPGAPFSNMPYAVRLAGNLNVLALEQSIHELIRRHEALRTTFTIHEGQPIQNIAPDLTLDLTVNDLSACSEDAKNTAVQQCLAAAALYTFDLTEGPLLLVRLLRLDTNEHILLLTVHHIISDGWSMGIFWRELSRLYEASCQKASASLPALPIQYPDVAHWQRQWLRSEAARSQLAYWQHQLRPPLAMLELPADRPRTAVNLTTASLSFQIDTTLTTALKRLSQQEGVTLFMTLLAAFKMLLYSYTGQDDLRVGTLVANRQSQNLEGVIGIFANLVVLRTNMGNNPTLRDVLKRVRTVTLDACMHQEVPFEHLARTFEHDGTVNRLQLFQVMFSMPTDRQQSLQLPGLTTTMLKTQSIAASACDLAVSIHENDDGLEVRCIYKPALFSPETIQRMFSDFQRCADDLVEHSGQHLVDLRR
jgi:amino acid adenylation domain-containing protein